MAWGFESLHPHHKRFERNVQHPNTTGSCVGRGGFYSCLFIDVILWLAGGWRRLPSDGCGYGS